MINNYLMVISGVYYQIIFTLHLLKKKKVVMKSNEKNKQNTLK